jgi:hypothetical protein
MLWSCFWRTFCGLNVSLLVFATGTGYPAVGRVCTWPGVPGPSLYPHKIKPGQILQVQTWTRPITQPGFARFQPHFLSATIIPYFMPQLSIWVQIVLQYNLCINDAVFGALSPPGLRYGIRWIFVESLWNYAKLRVSSKATPWISIGLQIGD